MTADRHIDPAVLGIDLSGKRESQLFRWLLACLLFGKPVPATLAVSAYHRLVNDGIVSLDKLRHADWNRLVCLLDEAHYVRFDYSTASKLLRVANDMCRDYGSVHRMVTGAIDPEGLRQRLLAFSGIGPVTADLFVQAVALYWYTAHDPHDYASAKAVAELLTDYGYEVYVIGGAVRDLLLGKQPKDFDLVTNASPQQIQAIPELAEAVFPDTAQAYGVTRLKWLQDQRIAEIEIATFRKDIEAHLGRKATKVVFATLEDDVSRRDFTINALALDPTTDFVVDYVDGITDLQKGVVRFIGKPMRRIHEDPLRVLRAIRFKNQLSFTLDLQAAQALHTAGNDDIVTEIAVDRVRSELTRMLIHPSRAEAVRDLDRFGMLETFLPELVATKGIPQPPEFHAEGDVWKHTLLTLQYLPYQPSRQLAWAALLHDVGKAKTLSLPIKRDDRIRFNRHYAVGAEVARTILRRLKFSKHDIECITWMIYNHMSIDDLPHMRPSKQQRMLGHTAFEDLLELHRADAAASWQPGKRHGVRPRFKDIEQLWHHYQLQPPERRQPSIKRDLGVDGRWLLDYFGKEYDLRGPIIGYVLNKLDEWYRDEGVRNKQVYILKARDLINRYLRRHKRQAATGS